MKTDIFPNMKFDLKGHAMERLCFFSLTLRPSNLITTLTYGFIVLVLFVVLRCHLVLFSLSLGNESYFNLASLYLTNHLIIYYIYEFRVHDLETMNELCKIEAHDAEVLCLEYSQLPPGHKPSPANPYFLASASRSVGYKQGRKLPLDTSERKIARRKSEKEREREKLNLNQQIKLGRFRQNITKKVTLQEKVTYYIY